MAQKLHKWAKLRLSWLKKKLTFVFDFPNINSQDFSRDYTER